MSDTVKLIIEIPKERYTDILRIADVQMVRCMPTLEQVVANGTPLDNNSDRAEVQAYFDGESFGWDEGREALIEELKAEIDEQYDRVHPYNIDVAQGLEMALGILDRIGKESEG